MTTPETALSAKVEQLIDALRACGPGWHSRAAIAQQLNKRRLNAYETAVLDTLVASGRVLAERHAINAPIRERWEYKIK